MEPSDSLAGRPSPRQHRQPLGRTPSLALAAAVLAWPMLAGLRYGPGRPLSLLWYRSLRMPPWKPPDVVVPVAWTLIDTALAWAAYRLLRHEPAPGRGAALAWLAFNVASIGGWSALFFGRRRLDASTALAVAMVGTGLAGAAAARRVDPVAARAGIPFIAWVGFAAVLTNAIRRRNPGR